VVEILITTTPDPNATVPVKIITTTPLPGQVLGIPTDILSQAASTPAPSQTFDATALGADPDLQGTVTALPENCILHAVEAGDTPFAIAELYGADGFALLAVNGLTEETAAFLQIGEVLIVPLEGCPLQPQEAPAGAATALPNAEDTEEPEDTRTPTVTPTITLVPTAINAQVDIVQVIKAGDVTSEGIEIRNNGPVVDLSDWTLSDAEGNVYVFPERRLFTGGQLTVYTRVGEDTAIAHYWGRTEAIWDPSDVVTLADEDGRVQATLRLTQSVDP
jgi:hypothetical protein